MTRDWTGHKQGMLTVLRRSPIRREKDKHIFWECLCECGKTTTISSAVLHEGQKSCGCLLASSKTTHNGSKTRLYVIYLSMIRRCENPKTKTFNLYGGRGISVCKEWKDSFENFRDWAISNGYNESAKRGATTLDRIDVNGNYCPENCRICDQKTQARNTRRNVFTEINGQTKNLSEWAEISGICYGTLHDRYKHGVRGEMLIHKGSLHGLRANYQLVTKREKKGKKQNAIQNHTVSDTGASGIQL